MGQAIMPEGLLEVTVGDLLPDESGWVVPWAIEIDAHRACWIRRSYPVQEKPGLFSKLLVQRMELGDIHCIMHGNHKWEANSKWLSRTLARATIGSVDIEPVARLDIKGE